MQFLTLALTASAALMASAVPHQHSHLHKRQSADTFTIDVHNQCNETHTFAIYQITSEFTVNKVSPSATIRPGHSRTIQAPFQETGLRLSMNENQWAAQTLFEFGYSAWSDLTGTAYDLSVMSGSQEGISVEPSNSACPSKICFPDNCSASEGWTNADQVSDGSPADTVCYQGMTDFKVTFCPPQTS
ncbi:hypothetical protein M433DRAFT_8812 [Acidomyces richmondensis BFW]|nr:MAG: hypothetical protein FE78DRAFT_490608 [Acidomyces sp. 'richmondensis']KYG40440.1 hypothetical protein M433DRAFT_8812 [Acidomyces richmondensis BFW]